MQTRALFISPLGLILVTPQLSSEFGDMNVCFGSSMLFRLFLVVGQRISTPCEPTTRKRGEEMQVKLQSKQLCPRQVCYTASIQCILYNKYALILYL